MARLHGTNQRNSSGDESDSYANSYNAPLTRADTALHRLIKEYAVDKSVLDNTDVKRQVMQSLCHRPRRIITRGMLALIDRPDIMGYEYAGPIKAHETSHRRNKCMSYSPYGGSNSDRCGLKGRKTSAELTQREKSKRQLERWNMMPIGEALESDDVFNKDYIDEEVVVPNEPKTFNPECKSKFTMNNHTRKAKSLKFPDKEGNNFKTRKNLIKLEVLSDEDFGDSETSSCVSTPNIPAGFNSNVPYEKEPKTWMNSTLNSMSTLFSVMFS